MKKNINSKKLLFENMEKLNPNFKLQEIAQQPIAGDIANLQKVTQNSPGIQTANSRIDTPQEFEQGFTMWMSTTGFNPQKKPLTISQAQTSVKNAMMKLGYK